MGSIFRFPYISSRTIFARILEKFDLNLLRPESKFWKDGPSFWRRKTSNNYHICWDYCFVLHFVDKPTCFTDVAYCKERAPC